MEELRKEFEEKIQRLLPNNLLYWTNKDLRIYLEFLEQKLSKQVTLEFGYGNGIQRLSHTKNLLSLHFNPKGDKMKLIDGLNAFYRSSGEKVTYIKNIAIPLDSYDHELHYKIRE